jgi:hypothetical protein
MGKLLMKKLISSIFLLFVSCCYLNRNISVKNKLYFERIENFSNQPNLTFVLKEKLEEIFIKYPKFEIVSSKEASDYIIDLKIIKFTRTPLFFSTKDSNNIVGGKYEVEIDFVLKEKNGIIINKRLNESFSTTIYKEYNEDKILSKICERISKKLYFEIIKME